MIGTSLAHYEITGHLGTGGMGEVYQATDAKLGRNVAIKLLPEAFTHDTERVARFQREARVLASLNHPNIAAIYGVEESADRKFLVMELVPGETLAERIRRGAIPLEESLGIAMQITEALEAAHEKGVVHRDLKPANIKLTAEGKVKVLDFGLSKAFAGEVEIADMSNSPTLSVAVTRAGMILGTAAYMSPEQAKGKPIDRRADIWAFGAVLYELITRQQLFKGEDVSETLACVLRDSPDWASISAGIPAPIVNLLRRCLQKDGSKRLQHIGDARIEIEEYCEEIKHGAAHSPWKASNIAERVRRRERIAWIAAGLLAVSLVTLFIWFTAAVPNADVMTARFSVNPTEMANPYQISVSPDGRKLAFAAASADGIARIFLRPLDTLEARELSGTDGAVNLFWSPDSRFIGFFANGKMKKVEWTGGQAQILCDAAANAGATWNRNDVIVFGNSSLLYRVAAHGGATTVLTELNRDREETAHLWPYFLPDGEHFLFFVLSTQDKSAIYVGSLNSRDRKALVNAFSMPLYASSGHLLFVRDRALMAQPFDSTAFQMRGDAFPVAQSVFFNPSSGQAAVSISGNGVLGYRSGNELEAQLMWFDRTGKPLGPVGSPGLLENPELSPDGRHIALDIQDPKNANRDIWLIDTLRGLPTRLTFDPSVDAIPVWSPDGGRIAFWSNRKGGNVFQMRSNGTGEELVLDTDSAPQSWTPDGGSIIYRAGSPAGLWVLPMTGDKKPIRYLQTQFWIRQTRLSPDGRWIAYTSDEPGMFQVFLQSFPNPSVKKQISTEGGMQPRWRGDSKELFYVAADGKLMKVSVKPGEGLEDGGAIALFETPLNGTTYQNAVYHQYDVSADGSRFLLRIPRKGSTPAPITVIMNWTAGRR